MDVQGVSLSTASSMDVQNVSLSTASSMNVKGVSLSIVTLWTCRVYPFPLQQYERAGCIHFHSQQYGHAGIAGWAVMGPRVYCRMYTVECIDLYLFLFTQGRAGK